MDVINITVGNSTPDIINISGGNSTTPYTDNMCPICLDIVIRPVWKCKQCKKIFHKECITPLNI